MIIKEIDAHNARIKAKRTLLKKMVYKPNYMASEVFKNVRIPTVKIERLIADNPDMDAFAIYRMLK